MGRRYYLVAEEALPAALRKAAEARRMLESHEARTVGQAARAAGISRSAFYKYKDAVWPFTDRKAEQIITFQAMLKDRSGVLSRLLGGFAASGANILTINQTIPVNGCAAVTISAETSGMTEPVERLLEDASGLEGVITMEILAGESRKPEDSAEESGEEREDSD